MWQALETYRSIPPSVESNEVVVHAAVCAAAESATDAPEKWADAAEVLESALERDEVSLRASSFNVAIGACGASRTDAKARAAKVRPLSPCCGDGGVVVTRLCSHCSCCAAGARLIPQDAQARH